MAGCRPRTRARNVWGALRAWRVRGAGRRRTNPMLPTMVDATNGQVHDGAGGLRWLWQFIVGVGDGVDVMDQEARPSAEGAEVGIGGTVGVDHPPDAEWHDHADVHDLEGRCVLGDEVTGVDLVRVVVELTSLLKRWLAGASPSGSCPSTDGGHGLAGRLIRRPIPRPSTRRVPWRRTRRAAALGATLAPSREAHARALVGPRVPAARRADTRRTNHHPASRWAARPSPRRTHTRRARHDLHA